MSGTLFVVATPIGNLADISSRALDVLRNADRIVAEDTRHTLKLLRHFDIDKPMTSAHKFNEASRIDSILSLLDRGERIALVSDAGTPGLSDPGGLLVAAALKADVRVEPIPGPSALTAALSASGFDADRFYFAGFLPVKGTARRRELELISRLERTIVLYEAPHRLVKTLADLAEHLGQRTATVCRELTKLHEEVAFGSLEALHADFSAREMVKGEIVLVLAPPDEPIDETGSQRDQQQLVAAYEQALEDEEGDSRRALRRLSRDLGLPRAELKYRLRDRLEGSP